MALQQGRTINELIKIARLIEETGGRVQKCNPPPTSTRSLIEPELAYRKVSTYYTYVETDATRNG